MQIPLVVEPNDYRWKLLREILNIFEMRKTKKIVAKFTSPVKTAINCIKITLTSMFFSTGISHVVDELERRSELKEFLGVEEVPKTACIYSFLSKFNLNSFIAMILRILNSVTRRRQRNTRLIVDCTDISVDINWFRKPVKQLTV